MNSEIVMRIDRSLARQGFQPSEVMHLDDTELSLHERELLVQFRLLSLRQQNALLALMDHTPSGAATS